MTDNKPSQTIKVRNIVVAWAEHCVGPGWANAPIWYIERLERGKLEMGCIQPEEQTRDMRTLFSANALVTSQLIEMVSRKLNNTDDNPSE